MAKQRMSQIKFLESIGSDAGFETRRSPAHTGPQILGCPVRGARRQIFGESENSAERRRGRPRSVMQANCVDEAFGQCPGAQALCSRRGMIEAISQRLRIHHGESGRQPFLLTYPQGGG